MIATPQITSLTIYLINLKNSYEYLIVKATTIVVIDWL